MAKKTLLINPEGIEGCGKDSQVERMEVWLKGLGLKVRISREPGGSEVGERIRQVLLYRDRTDPLQDDERHQIATLMDNLAERIDGSGIDNVSALVDYVRTFRDRVDFDLQIQVSLFVLARLIHLDEVIVPYVRGETEDDVLILNRFWPSTFAYQVCTDSRLTNDRSALVFTQELYGWHLQYLESLGVDPIVIVLDLDPTIGLERVDRRGDGKSIYDLKPIEYHRSVRDGFLKVVQLHPAATLRLRVCRPHRVDATPSIEAVAESIQKVLLPYLKELIPQAH